MGGDEILIIDSESNADDLEKKMCRMSEELDGMGCSIAYGISRGSDTKDFNQLVNEADMAMLLNKDRYYKGKNIEHR